MSFCVVGQDFFRAFVLFGNDPLYFLVDHAGSLLAIRLGESPVLTARIVIIQVRKFFTHTEVDNHGVSLLGYPFQVIGCSGRYFTEEKFICCTSAQRCAHLIEHLFAGGDLAFFRHIPGCSQCFTSRYDSHLNQRIGMFKEPA